MWVPSATLAVIATIRKATRKIFLGNTGMCRINNSWHESYRAALFETEWTKMRQRIQVAESTINQRQRVLSEDHGGTAAEREAIDAAIHGLKVLRKETPEWLDRRGTTNSY